MAAFGSMHDNRWEGEKEEEEKEKEDKAKKEKKVEENPKVAAAETVREAGTGAGCGFSCVTSLGYCAFVQLPSVGD